MAKWLTVWYPAYTSPHHSFCICHAFILIAVLPDNERYLFVELLCHWLLQIRTEMQLYAVADGSRVDWVCLLWWHPKWTAHNWSWCCLMMTHNMANHVGPPLGWFLLHSTALTHRTIDVEWGSGCISEYSFYYIKVSRQTATNNKSLRT